MNKALLSSKRLDWCTPRDFFDALDVEFHFTLDAAATEKSAKCAKYYTPETDGLSASWAGETVFCHPPADDVETWARKCYEESQQPGTAVVLLTAAKTETSYFHDYILGKSELRFLKGRLILVDEDGNKGGRPATGSLLAVYRGTAQQPEAPVKERPKGGNKELVLGLIRGQDMTANEITERLQATGYDIDRGTVSPCLTKLLADRLVENIGKRPCKVTGKNAIAWRAAIEGGAHHE